MVRFMIYNKYVLISFAVCKDNAAGKAAETEATMAKIPGAETITFSLSDNNESQMQETLRTVYNALVEKGYNPINQIVGYILSEDPTYITNHNNARALIRKLDRDELLTALLKRYLNIK